MDDACEDACSDDASEGCISVAKGTSSAASSIPVTTDTKPAKCDPKKKVKDSKVVKNNIVTKGFLSVIYFIIAAFPCKTPL